MARPRPGCAISVVIPTRNRLGRLRACLGALSRQRFPRHRFEVVVVSDGSRRAVDAAIRRRLRSCPFETRFLVQRSAGAAAARNRAIEVARGRVLLFLGDDVRADRDLLRVHAAFHRRRRAEAHRAEALLGRIDWDPGLRRNALMRALAPEGALHGFHLIRDADRVPYRCFYTSNLSLPRSALGTQRFDERFRGCGWEDIELGYRLVRRGLRVRHDARARVWHWHPHTRGSWRLRNRMAGRNERLFHRLHPEVALRERERLLGRLRRAGAVRARLDADCAALSRALGRGERAIRALHARMRRGEALLHRRLRSRDRTIRERDRDLAALHVAFRGRQTGMQRMLRSRDRTIRERDRDLAALHVAFRGRQAGMQRMLRSRDRALGAQRRALAAMRERLLRAAFPPVRFGDGWHEPELLPEGVGRWSSARAVLRVRRGAPTGGRLVLLLSSHDPDGAQRLTVRCGRRTVSSGALRVGEQRVAFALPKARRGCTLRLSVRPTLSRTRTGDARVLGILLRGAVFAPVADAEAVP